MRWLKTLFGGAANRVSLAPAEQEMIENWRRLPAADLSVMHEEQRYVVVDVETSGLNMKKDRLISIGAVALVAGRLDFNDAFQVVLRQEQVSTHANILIHGISGSAQSAGVDPVEGLLAFLQYVGKSPLVAYHAFFDQSMIGKATREYLGMELAQPWIDLAWVLPDFFSFRGDANVALDDWLHHFGIESILRHNAVSDAYATAKLLQVAIAGGQQKGATSPVAFIRIEKARRWMQECR
jgi:DNA polymerase III subunit epsilon